MSESLSRVKIAGSKRVHLSAERNERGQYLPLCGQVADVHLLRRTANALTTCPECLKAVEEPTLTATIDLDSMENTETGEPECSACGMPVEAGHSSRLVYQGRANGVATYYLIHDTADCRAVVGA